MSNNEAKDRNSLEINDASSAEYRNENEDEKCNAETISADKLSMLIKKVKQIKRILIYMPGA